MVIEKLLIPITIYRMNQPIDEDGTVHFTTTLFALIREVGINHFCHAQEGSESSVSPTF